MNVRVTVKRVLLAALGALIAAILLGWSGIVQISASSGHWPVTAWFLNWTMRNSARTYSLFETPPAPPGRTELISAAGHFKQACQACHGAPGVRPSAVMQKATPAAPDLTKIAGKWRYRELFWIIEHGVKFTGMPAWGAEGRKDEVARMAAFVSRLPKMTAEDYRRLTESDPGPALPEVRPGVLAACTGCHGVDGRGRGQPDIPVLAGQRATYLAQSLRDYASGRRPSALMQVATASLTKEEIDCLAHHFAAMPGLTDALPNAKPSVISDGIRERQMPSCNSCHGPGKPQPRLGGQKATYLSARLRAWRGEEGIVDARKSSRTMEVIARRIPDEQIEAVTQSLSAAMRTDEHAGHGR